MNTTVVASKGGKKTDLTKQGISSVANAVVKNNLMGISKAMEKSGWVDSQGRKGKVCSGKLPLSLNFCHQLRQDIFFVGRSSSHL